MEIRRLDSAFPALDAACVRLGFNRICPEAIEAIRMDPAWAEDHALRADLHRFIVGMRALLAPKES